MSPNYQQIPYLDGYWYCYSNATAMLLGSIGESISPHLIEPLTGVGLGAMLHHGLPFFSGLSGEPDKGVSKSLEILGFQFEEKNKETGDAPFDELEKTLVESPVVIGPLDMSFLTYNPDRPKTSGVDHFVLVYKIENNQIYVNDPAGYAHVTISKEQLAKAWRAEDIDYKRGYYRSWSKPIRVVIPTKEEIYIKAMDWFKELYLAADEAAKIDKTLINSEAIRFLAKSVLNNELREYQIGFLTNFALPLGVKRALDYGNFLESFNSKLSDLKYKQADLFGESQSLLMARNNSQLSAKLLQLADIENEIRDQIFYRR